MALKLNPITGQMEDDGLPENYNDLAQQEALEQAPVQPQSPPPIDINQYLKDKYGLGNKYSDEARQELVDNSGAGIGGGITAALAALGAGFQGKDSTQAALGTVDSIVKGKQRGIDEFDKGRAAKIQEFKFDQDMSKAQRDEQIIADSKDPMSARSKAAQDLLVQDFGFNPELAAKMSAEQIEARIPTLKAKLDREFKEKELSERRLDRQAAQQQARDAKDLARQDKMEKEARPSEKQVKEFTEFDNALDHIEKIRFNKKSQDTGPVSAAQSKIAQFFGIDDAEKSAFKADVGEQLAQYIKSISGGAVTNEERADLMKNIPSVSDNDDTFNKKLDALESRLADKRRNHLTNTRKSGKNVSEFEREPSRPDNGKKEPETKVVNGKTYRRVNGGWEWVK